MNSWKSISLFEPQPPVNGNFHESTLKPAAALLSPVAGCSSDRNPSRSYRLVERGGAIYLAPPRRVPSRFPPSGTGTRRGPVFGEAMSDDKCPNCGAAMKTWNPIAHCDDDGFVGEWDVHDIDKVECLAPMAWFVTKRRLATSTSQSARRLGLFAFVTQR